jgi:hypothetical protein
MATDRVLVEHNDHFFDVFENFVYNCRCAGFIIRNVGTTTVRLNKVWILYPHQEYSLQSLFFDTVVNKEYLIQFEEPTTTPTTPNGGTVPTPKNHVIIAEEYYGNKEAYINYSPLNS